MMSNYVILILKFYIYLLTLHVCTYIFLQVCMCMPWHLSSPRLYTYNVYIYIYICNAFFFIFLIFICINIRQKKILIP